MGAIQSNLRLNDGMTSVLRRINSALLTCLDSFESLQGTSSSAINVENITAARSQLIGVTRELEEINSGQQGVNNSIQAGTSSANDLWKTLKGVAGAVAGFAGVKKLFTLSDELVTTKSRLALMADEAHNADQLFGMVACAAKEARGDIQDMTDVVARFGNNAKDAFSSNEEVIAFSTLVQKQMKIAGASSSEAANSMLQLSQALGSGILRGDELNSIFEQAPNLIQSIADYLGTPIGEIRTLASEGQLSADVVKAAVFASADEINAKFESMPMTWGQIWQQMQNDALVAAEPILNKISELAKSDKLQAGIQLVMSALNSLIPVLISILDITVAVGTFFVDNWSWIEPIVWGIVGALIAYEAISKGVTIILAAMALAENIKGAAQMLATGKTIAETTAQYGLNAALLACPITWIIILIVALIAIIWQWVKSVGGIKNAWEICKAALMVAWNAIKVAWYAVVYGVIWGVNKVLDFVDLLKRCWKIAGVAIADFMGDMKVKVLTILQNMINAAIDIINGFIGVLNKIPGVNIGLVEKVTFATTAAAENEAAKQARKEELAKYEQELAANKAARDANLANAKGNLDNAVDELSASAEELQNIYAASKAAANSGNAEDTAAGNIESIIGGNNGVEAIAENTAGLKETTEDLKYMRDLAEQEAINRFTTAEVKIDMSGMTNRIDSDVDIDGFINALTEGFSESLETAAEGVHA